MGSGVVVSQDAKQVIERILEEAKAADAAPRFVRVASPGTEIRQGDVYLYPVESRAGVWNFELATRQLAPGTTAGSRHVIEGDACLYARPSRSRFDGPLLEVRTRAVLTHPEHAHISLPAGWYEVAYQREYSTMSHELDDGKSPWGELTQGLDRVHD